MGTADDLEALRAASADGDLGAAIAAVDAGAAIVRAGRAAPPAAWRATLLERLGDPRPAMRAAAITAAAAWLLDPELEAALALAARGGLSGERSRALVALAGARSSAAGDLAVEAASDPDPWVRAAAARAAGSLEALELLDRLAADDSAQVRESAFAARAELEARPRPDLYTRYLADPATGVRASVLDRLATAPVVPFEPILNAFAKDERSSPELALAGVAALRARAESAPTERGSIVAALEGLAEVGTYPVRIERRRCRRVARPAASRASAPRPPRARRATTAAWSRRPVRPRWVRLETSRGDAVLRLDPSEAPLQSIAFLKLAEQGFYDGTQVYRVLPGLRLEAGDPDGDGRGGPGFTLRDEPSPRRLEPGAFGLVRPAAHAAGSRFFVQLGPDAAGEGEVTRLGRGGVRSRRPGGAARGRPHRPRCAGSRPPS